MEVISEHPKLLSDLEVVEALKCPAMGKYQEFAKYRGMIRSTHSKERKQLAALGDAERKAKPITNERETMEGYNNAKLVKLEDTAWMKEKVLNYLSDKPCMTQSRSDVKQFIGELTTLLGPPGSLEADEQASLTRGELLQVLNLRPTTKMRLASCVPSLETRMKEDQIDALLKLIVKYLPEPPEIVEESDEDDEELDDEDGEEVMQPTPMDVDESEGIVAATSKYDKDTSVMDQQNEEQL